MPASEGVRYVSVVWWGVVVEVQVHRAWYVFFFFNDTATTEIYTLSLHDALPISVDRAESRLPPGGDGRPEDAGRQPDRKSTRLNSSHLVISYAVFCLKKKKTQTVSSNYEPLPPQPDRRVNSYPHHALHRTTSPPT